jgi:DNA primase
MVYPKSLGVHVAARFDESLVGRVQQASDIVEVISEHLALNPKGRELVGLCPFHKDTRPSMYVNPVKQIFKCFACGAGGTVFHFIQLRENLTFPQAIERLAHRAGIEVKPVAQSGPREGLSPQSLAKLNAWAMAHWQGRLGDENAGRIAREYIDRRGISAESVKKWALGFAPESWDDMVGAAARKKIPDKALVEGGLAVKRDTASQGLYDKFRNRLMFPITDVAGKVLAFGGRTLGDDPAKYMNSPATVLFDKSNTVYGLQQARHAITSSGTVVVVEGYMDCLMCHQFGVENVVAGLGTSFTAGQAHLLRRYANRIVLLFDSDVAGAAASSRALEICLEEGIDIKLAFVPQGKDPCDFLLAAGKDSLLAVINGAADVMDFKWDQLKESFKTGDTLGQRAAATRQFVHTLAAALRAGKLDRITRGLILNRVAALTGLSPRQLEDEIAAQIGALNRTASYKTENSKVVSLDLGDGWFAKAQREVVEVLLNDPSLTVLAAERISSADFDVPALKDIAGLLFDSSDRNDNLSVVEILSRVESTDTAAIVVQLQQEGEKKGNYRPRLIDAVKAMLDAGRKVETAADDETQRLMSIAARARKPDLRNIGMK